MIQIGLHHRSGLVAISNAAILFHLMMVNLNGETDECPHHVIGLSQRSPGNRAKSPSVEHSVSPCSTASAAR
jgi:hypothetical protein